MRKLVLLSAILAGGLLSTTAKAQIGVSIGVNIGRPVVHVPVATPPIAYDAYYNNYYYLPDVGAYYSVGERVYYYNDGRRWVSGAYVPGYRNYDWRTARRYEVHANRPYLNHDYYRSRYNDRRDDYRGNDRYDNRYNDRFDNRYDDRGRGQSFDRGNNGRGRGNGDKFADNRSQGRQGRPGRG